VSHWTSESRSGQIEQVIVNLTVNACDAMPEAQAHNRTHNVIVDEKWRPPTSIKRCVRAAAVTDTAKEWML